MMVKSKKRNNIIGIILAIALLIFILYQADVLPLATVGTSILSLSKVNLQSNVPDGVFSGESLLLTFSSRELAQSYNGYFSSSEIESYSDGLEVGKGFEINVNYEDQKCRYDIRKDNVAKPIYQDLEKKTYGCVSPTENNALENTPLGAIPLRYGAGTVIFTCYVVYANKNAILGDLEQPDLESEFTISVKIDGKSEHSKTFNTLDSSTRGKIGNNIYAIWQGNLDSGIDCDEFTGNPLSSVRTAYYDGNWRVISKSAYTNYLNELSKSPNYLGGIDEWIDNVNDFGNYALSSKSFGSIKNSNDQQKGYVEVIASSQLQFPLTSLYIKASELNVFTPITELSINSVDSKCFSTGSDGSISVEIENKGNINSGYDLYATCDNGFTSERRSGTLNPQEKRILQLPLESGANKKVLGTCSVKLEDNIGRLKTKSVGVCVDPIVTCNIPYPKTFCGIDSGDTVIKQCSQDGVTEKIIERCASDEFCQEGICKSVGGGISLLDKIKKFFEDLLNKFTIIRYLIIIISSLIVGLSSRVLIQDKILRKKRKEYDLLVLMISILVGVGVGFLLYIFLFDLLWWVLGATIIFFFLMRFIPSINFLRRKR